MGETTIAVLGPLTLTGENDDGPVPVGPRDRVVLAALTTRAREVVSAEQLADALWGDRAPASWNKVVPGCVLRLRRALGPTAIETTPHGYRLAVPAEAIDAQRFERLVSRGRELLMLGESERAAITIGEALALWRGRPLQDAEGWEPARVEAMRLEELRLDAEEARIDACLRSGQHREVLAEAQARVAEAPLRERRWALLATAQYQTGRQGEALRTLRQARTVLATELGVDPGPELVELEQAVLRQDPALVVQAALQEPTGVCPYLGLVPYDVGDAEAFFGRDAEVAECMRRLAATGALAVVGASGSGKSSLVRAGLVAAFRRDGRRTEVVTPGRHPMDVLTFLPPDALLVVDQCEEAVLLCDDAAERTRFLAALAERSERSAVVVAVRADRLGDLSAVPAFARMVQRGFLLLGAMGEGDLRAAIEGPAHQAGLRLEPGLVDLLVHEVEGEPGALPLLSHALRRTWERREGRTLTVAGYTATGGIRGAVAQSAEEVYEATAPGQRPVLQDMLLRLVAAGPDGEPIRGRVPRRSLTIDVPHEELLERLIAARLVTTDEGVIELAHEALARSWPRLQGWLDDDAGGQRILRHLVGAAETWDAMGRPDSELYRGDRLGQALAWQRGAHRASERDLLHADLSATEREFLAAGEREAVRERRSARRRRTLIGAVGGLLVVALLAAMIAIRQGERADSAAVAAEARRIASVARDADELDRAMLLAVEAVRRDDSSDTRAALLDVLTRSPGLIRARRTEAAVLAPGAGPILDVSPDGEMLLTSGGMNLTALHEAGTLDVVGTHGEFPFRAEFRPDGEQLAMSTTEITGWGDQQFDPEPLRLVDPLTFEEEAVQLGGLPAGHIIPWDIDYSADGRYLAAVLDVYAGDEIDLAAAEYVESVVMVWDVTEPERPVTTIESEGSAVALSPRGRRVYVHVAGTVDAYEVGSGDRVASTVFPNHPPPFGDGLEVSPDGSTLAVVDDDEVAFLDAVSLAERRRLAGHTSLVNSVQFSHDGSLVASGAEDGTVVVWNVLTGERREILTGHTGAVRGLDFGPDDDTLYTVSSGRELFAWDLVGERRLMPRTAGPRPDQTFYEFAVPAPDGDAVAYLTRREEFLPSSLWGQSVQFLDVEADRLGESVDTDHGNWGPTWRPPDFEQFATTDADGWVHVWDWRRGEVVAERRVAPGAVGEISYNVDGTAILVSDQTGILHQVDSETLEPVGPAVAVADHEGGGIAPAPDGRSAVVTRSGTGYVSIDLIAGRVLDDVDLGVGIMWPEISPDGTHLAVGTASGEVGLVDLESGRWVRPPTAGHAGSVLRIAYAPDGEIFASSGHDGLISLWDGRTGELLTSALPGVLNLWATIEFLPDGHTLVVATQDGAVYEWDTSLEHWIEFACRVAGRDLTEAEWRDVLGDEPYRPTCS